MTRITFYKLLSILFLSGAIVFARAEPKSVSVLTVGNSFAENALTYLAELAEDAGHTLIEGRANLSGSTMERHWNHVAQFEKDPESEGGSPYKKGEHSLDGMLRSRDWDFITIQQVSMKSHDLETYRPFAGKLHRYITERAPDSKILAHQIWAYRIDDPRFGPAHKEVGGPRTQREMYEQVREAYHTLAAELNLSGILPSGDAMYLADTDPEWGYRPDEEFDFENATPPGLPKQEHSLHTGWYWSKNSEGIASLRLDGHHAGQAGKYLLGCVWFEVLFGESVVENSFVPKGIDADYAKFLRETAHSAVENLKKEQQSKP